MEGVANPCNLYRMEWAYGQTLGFWPSIVLCGAGPVCWYVNGSVRFRCTSVCRAHGIGRRRSGSAVYPKHYTNTALGDLWDHPLVWLSRQPLFYFGKNSPLLNLDSKLTESLYVRFVANRQSIERMCGTLCDCYMTSVI